MWLVYNVHTGQQIGPLHEQPPQVGANEAVVEVPFSALLSEPLCEWSPARRGFVDIPRRGRDELLRLFTTEELANMVQNGPLQILRLLLAILLVRKPIRKDAPEFVSGVQAAQAAGFLTTARANKILNFEEP